MASSNGGTQVTTLKSIEAALKLVDTKKESLKRAFDDLQAHSSLLSSFPLSWSELDGHFSSVQKSLICRFQGLQQSVESSSDLIDSVVAVNESGGSDQLVTVNGGDPSPSSIEDNLSLSIQLNESQGPQSSSLNASIGNCSARPDLVRLCEKRDGLGLRNYFNDHPKERTAIQTELVSLFRVLPDAGEIVLDAMEGFYDSNWRSKGDKDTDLYRLRKSCLDLFEVLIETKPVLSDQVKERAKMMALEWKNKVSLNGDSPLEALGFLNLIVAYDIWGRFPVDDLIDYFVVVARFKQATDLCRAIPLGDKINDLVQKLIENEKHLLAVKYIFEFGLTEKFQPVPLLKDHLNECKGFSKKICEGGKNSAKEMNDAKSREVNALKAVLKIVDEHKLYSEYPRQELESQLEMLQKQKADKKVAAPSPNNRSQQPTKKQQQQQQPKKQQVKKQRLNGNKRPHSSAPTGPVSVPGSISGSSSAVHSFQQSHLPPTGLLPTAGPYGLISSAPISSYSGASAGPYSMAGVPMSYTGNPGPSGAHPYSAGNPGPAGAHPYSAGNPGSAGAHPYSAGNPGSAGGHPYPDPYAPTGYYDRSAGYGGYSLPPPQYHPGYYPQ